MKVNKIFILLGFILVIGLVIGCALDDSLDKNESKGTYDELAYTIARALSTHSMIENEIIYKLCHQYDGDHSILFRYLSPEFAESVPKITNTSYNGYELELKMPMASIWSLNEIDAAGGLVIASVPLDIDDMAITRLTGYRKNGEKVTITKKNSKTIPYILISCSERVSEEGIIMYGPNKGHHVNEIYFSPISRSGSLDRSTKLGLIKKEDIPITLNFQTSDTDNPSDPVPRHTNVPTNPPTPSPTPTPPPVYLYSRVKNYSNEIQVTKKTSTVSTPSNKQTITWKQVHVKKDLDDDGWAHWLDGDLELEFKLYQDLFEITVDLSSTIGFYSSVHFEYQDFYVYQCEHDWEKTKTYNVNFTEYLTMLQSFQIPNTNYYLFNKKLKLKVVELDSWSANEVYLHTAFYVDLYFDEYNDKWWFKHSKIGVLFESNNYIFLC